MSLLIKDLYELKFFIAWLPELESHERYYGEIFARKKYNPLVISDRNGLGRFKAKNKDQLLNELNRLNTHASFIDRRGNIVPDDALAVYLCINPRNKKRAEVEAIKEFISDSIHEGKRELSELVWSQLHKAKSKSFMVAFDIDNETFEKVESQIREAVNITATAVTITRGGFHLFVNPKKVEKRYLSTWYNKLSEIGKVDVLGDMMTPLPGVIQGGHVPTFWLPTIDRGNGDYSYPGDIYSAHIRKNYE